MPLARSPKPPADAPCSPWKTLNRILLLLITIVSAALIYFLYYPETSRLHDLRRKLDRLTHEKNQAELENLLLQRQIHLLHTDPEYLELLARDKLDLMKPGETIFRLDPRPIPGPPSLP